MGVPYLMPLLQHALHIWMVALGSLWSMIPFLVNAQLRRAGTPLTSGKYGAHRSMPLSSSRSTWDTSQEVKVELIYIAHSGDPDNSSLGWPSF